MNSDTKIIRTIDKMIKILNKSKLTVPELVVLYGNLGYYIGASIAGIEGRSGPGMEELKREYYSNPTIDVGLMIQGLMITDWELDFIKNPKLSRFYKENKKNVKNKSD